MGSRLDGRQRHGRRPGYQTRPSTIDRELANGDVIDDATLKWRA